MAGTQSVDRAADLLVAVLRSDDGLSVSELTQTAQLPKSTVSRLVRALERRGLVQREGARGSLRPGSVLVSFARRASSGLDLVPLADGALTHLAEATGETVNLAVPGTTGVEHLAQRDSRHFLGSTSWIGRRVPFHAAANGKVFLAYGAAALPEGDLERLTPRTIANRLDLEDELARVRARGYATSMEELELGLVAVAAPVFGAHGELLAAISVSAPTIRLAAGRLEEILGLLVESTTKLSSELTPLDRGTP